MASPQPLFKLPLLKISLLCLTAQGLLAVVPRAVLAQRPQLSPAESTFFEQEVRPLLVQRCYGCHSGATPKGGLALDSRAGWVRGGQSGAALVPGDPAASLLLKAVRHAPGTSAMPPNSPLPDREIATLTRWIQIGAPDPRILNAQRPTPNAQNPRIPSIPTNTPNAQRPTPNASTTHWAFQPLKTPSLPAVKEPSWCRTPIDRFILAKLEAKGLKPAPPADRRTLIRRVTYDLTGLPPTPAEVNDFLNDKTPNAYEKLIDRLLASPRYGERWGRHWLDLVHYGDTHGYDKDKRRDHAWPYRDYVIRAFNTDKPYDRFIKEQIAGDALYSTDPDGIVATGFLAAGPWDFVGHAELREGTVEKDKTRLIDRDDMVATTISTFNSMTVHCARCHDHKFDPIPQRDYYRLQAVFAGIDRADRPYDDPQTGTAHTTLRKRETDLTTRQSALLTTVRALTSPELTRLDDLLATSRQQLTALPPPVKTAGSPSNGYHSGVSPTPDVTKWVQVDLGGSVPLDEVRLLPARPTDFPDTPGFGFPVRFRVEASDDPAFPTGHTHLLLDQTHADLWNPGDTPFIIPASGTSARYVRVTATRLWPRTNDYVFALAELQVFTPVSANTHRANIALGKPVTALDSIEAGRWSTRNLVDNYDSRNPLPDLADPTIAALVAQRAALEQHRTELMRARQTELDRLTPPATLAELQQIDRDLLALHAQIAALPAAPMVYAVQTHAPRPIYLLHRGDVEQKGEQLLPGALSCVRTLSADFKLNAIRSPVATTPTDSSITITSPESAGRVALAEWIASGQNMLTWRSIVNRVWQYHVGRGIVDTPSDFGRNGTPPTHPELLDWLASQFRGGVYEYLTPLSLKSLHRLILLSAVYRQASASSDIGLKAGLKVDADNRLLWRMPRRRLEAEEVRDSVLAISGKLDTRMGGPGFELFRFKDDHSPIYDFSSGEKSADPGTFRRTIYQFVVRSVPDPFLESLDSPDPSILTPVRNTTLTALQALALRNDPFMIRQSEFLAERLRESSQNESSQIDLAYNLLLGRSPSPKERTELATYAHKQGLPNACRLLFNTNEFVFVE